MRKIILFIILLVILFFPSCKKEKRKWRIYNENDVTVVENKGSGLWGSQSSEKIEFIEELSLGLEEGEDHLMFHHLSDVAVDTDLNMYILDGSKYRLLKFDEDGNFIWQIGRKGEGPREFKHPNRVIVIHTEEVVVSESLSINFFNTQGKFQRSIKIEKFFQNIIFLPDGRLFINISLMGQPGVAAEYYSAEGKFLEKFPAEYRYGPKMPPNLGASIGDSDFQLIGDRIYLSIPDQYEIREYDLDGRILRKIKRDIKLKPPNIILKVYSGGSSVHTRPSDSSGPCFFYKNEMLINCFQLVEKKSEKEYVFKRFLDFFNKKGQFLGSYELPENYNLNTIDIKNRFYFIQEDPFPKLIRSKLQLK